MKRNTTAGIYVIGGIHYIDLQPGQEAVYPDSFTSDTFANMAALQRKYPKLPDQAQKP